MAQPDIVKGRDENQKITRARKTEERSAYLKKQERGEKKDRERKKYGECVGVRAATSPGAAKAVSHSGT